MGRICSCYALFVKETKGNELALEIFKSSLKILPDSFDLRREYYSHIACMNLYDNPLDSFGYYQQILKLFEDQTPDSAALPFHEYGDLAMCQLIAGNLEYALELVDEAIEICQSNGVSDEEGRCFNIRGCIEWRMRNLEVAEENLCEAMSIMDNYGYIHYAWRCKMNLLQLSLITGHFDDKKKEMLKILYTDYCILLKEKINHLIEYDVISFRKSREYHGLLVLGILLNKIEKNSNSHLKICKDFNIEKYSEIYVDDLNTLLSGNYHSIPSPYIQDGYIYLVG